MPALRIPAMNSPGFSFVIASSSFDLARATFPPQVLRSLASWPPDDGPSAPRSLPLAKNCLSGSEGSGGASAPEALASESSFWFLASSFWALSLPLLWGLTPTLSFGLPPLDPFSLSTIAFSASRRIRLE
jgi:hypothetical protein